MFYYLYNNDHFREYKSKFYAAETALANRTFT